MFNTDVTMPPVLTQEGVQLTGGPNASSGMYEKPTRIILRTRKLLEIYFGISQQPDQSQISPPCNGTTSSRPVDLPLPVYSLKKPNEPSAPARGDEQSYDTLESLRIPTDSHLINYSENLGDDSSPANLSGRPLGKTKETYCGECNRDYRTNSNYGKHRRDVHEKVRYQCTHPRCQKSF